ncbi:MAG: hercynine metabolism protein [Synechococcaceae cyanobacterium ELA739]
MSWLDDLESRLDSQLEAFLRSSPAQEALLAEQERQDRLSQLRRQRLELQQQAEQQRQELLQLAVEIRQWQERVERARTASATELAHRAESHIAGLMERGRLRWQGLAELGQQFNALEWELTELGRRPTSGAGSRQEPNPSDGASPGTAAPEPANLDSDWAAFEAQQELEALKRRMQR